MWYRGADLNLAMVNTAYVAAVEGRDAADVVARWGRTDRWIGAPMAARWQGPHVPATRKRRSGGSSMRRSTAIAVRLNFMTCRCAMRGSRDLRSTSRISNNRGRARSGSPMRSARCSTGCRQVLRSSAPTGAWSSATSHFAGSSRCAANGCRIGPNSIACSSGCARRGGCPRFAIFLAGRRSGATGSCRVTRRARRIGICRAARICASSVSPYPMAGCC